MFGIDKLLDEAKEIRQEAEKLASQIEELKAEVASLKAVLAEVKNADQAEMIRQLVGEFRRIRYCIFEAMPDVRERYLSKGEAKIDSGAIPR